jgi:hypothetical protein
MQAEDVSVQVVERGSAAVAVVKATFDMANPGATAQIMTGFPSFAGSAVPASGTYTPTNNVMFTPANISNFRAWTDTANFTPTKKTVKTSQYGSSDWFVWNMSYPRGTTRVYVSYDQKISPDLPPDSTFSPSFTNVSYVLRTGALWAGTIGSAHVTFDAPNGGIFVDSEKTTEASDTHLAWQLNDVKPTFDPDAVYVYRKPWQELQAAQAVLATGGAAPSDYLRAAQAALSLLGTGGPWGEPPTLVNRYASAMREWAWNASQLDSAEAWEAVGDVEKYAAMPDHKNHGEFACWPDAGAAAYDRAAELGSTTAADKRADMDDTLSYMQKTFGPPQSC